MKKMKKNKMLFVLNLPALFLNQFWIKLDNI